MSSRERFLRSALAELMEVDEHVLSPTMSFAEMGVDSLIGLRFSREIQEHVQAEIELEWLFDHPTLCQLADFLDQQFGCLDTAAGHPG